ncbi:MAG TPA: hypothetical protein VIH82_11135 [Acidimicrobiia bacterium]
MLARAWSVLTGEEDVRPLTVVAWAALVVLMGVCLVDTLTYDFTVHRIVGDEASHIFTTLSVGGSGHNLSYDIHDLEAFNDLQWMPRPYGLYFQQYNGNGWAYAKPYGYGVYAGPFASVFGTIRGVAVANTFLLLVLAAVSVATLRLRYRGPVVPLTVGAFVFLGLPFFYAYVIHPDLLLATLTAIVFFLVLLHWRTKHVALAAAAAAVSALLVVENPRTAAAVLPAFVVVLWELRSWVKRAIVVGVGIVALGIVVTPNYVYSNGGSWNAYAGDRYQAVPSLGNDVPFDGVHTQHLQGWRHVHTGENSTPSKFLSRIFEDPEREAQAAFNYFFGRHTGMLVFVPVGFLILALVLVRIRTLDRHAWAILIGILGYITVYVLVWPKNYYGGAQSLGNRYFLQIAPGLLALAVAAQLRTRALLGAALGGALLAVLFLFPHFEDPSAAYSVDIARTSWLQRQLPFEGGISYSKIFQPPTR